MAQETASPRWRSNAYNFFILVLTVIALVIMVAMFLPLDDSTIELLQFYDNLICFIFLIDFFINLRAASPKSDYFIRQRGWLDLLGSIPSFGLTFRFSGFLRLARLSRFARIRRLLRGKNKVQLVEDVIKNRSHYAAVITILVALIVLTIASVLVLQSESQSQEANIKSAGDAIWYSIVTITTVGYGDRYPVTMAGRVTGMFIMITGVGIIGALASILSSILLGSSPAPSEDVAPVVAPSLTVEQEITAIKNELAALRQHLEKSAAHNDTQ